MRTGNEVVLNEKFFADNTRGMDSELAECYRTWLPMAQKAIHEFFPSHQTPEFLSRTLGFSPGEIDSEEIEECVVKPTYLYIDRPGKLLRPVLTALILDAYGADVHAYRSVLAMIEVMEVTTISLNDIWDESIYRRDGYCTHIVYDNDIAHVAGLAAYTYCLSLLFNKLYALDTKTALRLYRAFAFEDIQMFLGDAVETIWPLLKKNLIEENHYLQEIVSRIAFLSFRGPTRVGAILGGATDEQIGHLEQFGMLIGMAYHLRGDNLNIAPQSQSWGKVPYEDITAGRRTLLTSTAYRSATPEHRAEMADVLDSRTTDLSKINRFIELVNRYQAREYCETRALRFLEEAKGHLDFTGISERHKRLLKAFADFMVNRKK